MAESTSSKPSTDPDAIVEDYLRRIDAGEQIDREAYIAQHPEVAPALKSFFANEQLMRQWTAGDAAPAAKDTAPKDASPTIAPKSVAAAALTGAAGTITFPAMMGRYRLERELGRGAMGTVYLAHDTDLDRPVALKIPKFTAADNQELISRFLREARAAAVLAHPNICRVYDVNEHQGVRYIAMEFIEGKPLSAFIAGGNVQAKQAASVVRKLALGLAEAHQRNILHRDLKPDNILVNKQGEPVLTDFGLARETTQGKASATQDGVILGSPAYMPPEQAAGNLSEMGPPSDIYSLGVVLYELLTGEVPFRGSVVEVLASVLMKTPKTVREQKPDVDPGIAAICDKMMAKKAGDRYPTMMAVAQALGDWLRTGGQQQPATSTKLPEPLSTSGEFKIADGKSKLAAGPHVVEPKKIPGVNDKPKQTIVPGASKQTIQPAKVPERSEKQINELADLGDQLLARNDYLEAIRLAEEIPDYQRTSALRRMLGDAYELKGKVEKLERNLEKYLNQLDLPELKKTVTALLKIHPGHPRGKEIKKALNTGGKKAVVQILKDEGNYDAVGNVWDPKLIGGAIAAIVAMSVIAYFAVTIYIKGQMQTIEITLDDPTADVKIENQTVIVKGQQTGEIKLTLGDHQWVVERDGVRVKGPQSFTVTKDGSKKIEIKLLEEPTKPDDGAGGSVVAGLVGDKAGDVKELTALKTKFRWCPPGTFLMGSPATELGHQADEQGAGGAPVSVTLSQGFWMQETEVTQAQWRAVMNTTPWKGKDGVKEGDNFPAIYIPRGDDGGSTAASSARAYCARLTAQEHVANRIPAGYEFRLPTEVEREYACRAGTTTVFSFGDDFDSLAQFGWFLTNTKDAGEAYAQEVAKKKANPWGLYDMHGNVWEWCNDGYAAQYSGGRDPHGSGASGSARGGSWASTPAGCRSANRSENVATEATNELGFRPVLVKVASSATTLASGERVFGAHTGGVLAVVVSPDGRFVYSGGGDQSVLGWDIATGKELWKFETGGETYGLAVSPDGKQVALGSKGGTYIVNAATGEKIQQFAGPTAQTQGVAFTADGTQIVTAGGDGNVRRWNIAAGNEVLQYDRTGNTHAAIVISPDGSEVFSASGAGIEAWDFETGKTREFFKDAPAIGMEFSPDGTLLAAACDDKSIRVWNWKTRQLVHRFDGHTGRVMDVAFLPDGKHLASGGLDKKLILWNLETKQQVAAWNAHHEEYDGVRSVAATPNGQSIVSGGYDGKVRVWKSPLQSSVAASGNVPPAAVAPFDSAQAKAHQEAWAKHLNVPVEYTNKLGMKFQLIPPGEYMRGSTPDEIKEWAAVYPDNKDHQDAARAEGPQHKTILTKPFYLGMHEVTQNQYQQIMGVNPSSFSTTSANEGLKAAVAGKDTSNFPVETVSWDNATEFCAKLSESNSPAARYRLPSAAEWEFACRAGTTSRFWTGDDSQEIAAADNFTGMTRPVGEGKANPFGLYDLVGNVREWANDWWSVDEFDQFANQPAVDPQGASEGKLRIVRGGSWRMDPAMQGRSSLRTYDRQAGANAGYGFRVVLPVEAVAGAAQN